MSVQDFIKNSILESGAFDGASITSIILGLITAVAMGAVIYFVYSKFYTGVIYSRSFAVTLVGMTVLTAMVTLAISTNIVISLGMVGALSIVRFRTAIKDPMDLLYLFWAITTGITSGAGMYLLVLIAAAVMIGLIALFYHKQQKGRIYIAVVHYTEIATGDAVRRALAQNTKKHFEKSLTERKNTNGEKVYELTFEVFCKNNDTSFISKLQELEGVKDATLIQYNGEYHG